MEASTRHVYDPPKRVIVIKVLYTGTHTHFGHQETAVSCIDGIIRCGNVAKGTA